MQWKGHLEILRLMHKKPRRSHPSLLEGCQGRNPTMLRLPCCEKTQASHIERLTWGEQSSQAGSTVPANTAQAPDMSSRHDVEKSGGTHPTARTSHRSGKLMLSPSSQCVPNQGAERSHTHQTHPQHGEHNTMAVILTPLHSVVFCYITVDN